jgi:hypothetical protein
MPQAVVMGMMSGVVAEVGLARARGGMKKPGSLAGFPHLVSRIAKLIHPDKVTVNFFLTRPR